MREELTSAQLQAAGLSLKQAQEWAETLKQQLSHLTPEQTWSLIAPRLNPALYPFTAIQAIFSALFPSWPDQLEAGAAWLPGPEQTKKSNIARLMHELEFAQVQDFQRWTVNHKSEFWTKMLQKLKLVFQRAPSKIVDLSKGIKEAEWLLNSSLNIVDSCFNAKPEQIAVIEQDEQGQLRKYSYQQLEQRVGHLARSLSAQGFTAGDRLALVMPLHLESLALYLAIIKIGAVSVNIAESFSAPEMALRFKLIQPKAVFTQAYFSYAQHEFSLYERVIEAGAPRTFVYGKKDLNKVCLRASDLGWTDFLARELEFGLAAGAASLPITILFSSGTTAQPKAIPWNACSAIKAAADAYLHQNVCSNDVLAWPTSLGWMMGPWLIFAALMNQATLALYSNSPNQRAFGEFIERAEVTILGLVPTLVANWKKTRCMEGLNWTALKLLSSSGECSNPQDMLYIMMLAGHKPIIEYCGGTEISGAYLSSTVVQKNYLSTFSTAAMAMEFLILDEEGKAADSGEVALIPPALGLSNHLLNADHEKVYYAGMPQLSSGQILRRHGDAIRRLANGYYCVLGRQDDSMNLGGIKISAAELERALHNVDGVLETAAIAINNAEQGPSQLVVYAVPSGKEEAGELKERMQESINRHLNPLFKIAELILVSVLPKTASHKIRRGALREAYRRSLPVSKKK